MSESSGHPVSSMTIKLDGQNHYTIPFVIYTAALIMCACHTHNETTSPVISRLFWKVMAFGQQNSSNAMKTEQFAVWSAQTQCVSTLAEANVISKDFMIKNDSDAEHLKWLQTRDFLELTDDAVQSIPISENNQQITDALHSGWIRSMGDALTIHGRVLEIYQTTRSLSQSAFYEAMIAMLAITVENVTASLRRRRVQITN